MFAGFLGSDFHRTMERQQKTCGLPTTTCGDLRRVAEGCRKWTGGWWTHANTRQAVMPRDWSSRTLGTSKLSTRRVRIDVWPAHLLVSQEWSLVRDECDGVAIRTLKVPRYEFLTLSSHISSFLVIVIVVV